MSNISIESFVSQTYDYIIAGGGTAGLVLANRLTEDPSVRVAVLEAGGDHTTDPVVLVPGLESGQLENASYDWAYVTVPQKDANNNSVSLPRGKQLGGSSAINLLYQTYASQADINDWGELGNEGWSWDELSPYFLKSENFTDPSPQVSKDLSIDLTNFEPALHGRSGPIRSGFPRYATNLTKAWPPALDGLGIPPRGDPKDGKALGGFSNPLTQDTAKAERSYAGNAYWKPVSARPNLLIWTDALVGKVVFDERKSQHGNLKAIGVEFIYAGANYTVKASREVILSGGVFGSPQILELSGIGEAKLLRRLGINALLENSNVGENLQDHPMVTLSFEAKSGQFTLESLGDPALFNHVLHEYNANRTGPLVAPVCGYGFFSQAQIARLIPTEHEFDLNDSRFHIANEQLRPGLAEQYELTKRKVLDPNEAITQILPFFGGVNFSAINSSLRFYSNNIPGGHFASFFAAVEHPWSRGSSHINSADPTAYPTIDPRYLSHPLDVEILKGGVLLGQKIFRSEPIASLLQGGGTVYQPMSEEVTPENAERYIRSHEKSVDHPVGTCSMSPRHKGGVVNARLKVYGTSNLRVADASVYGYETSIFPLTVRGNIMSLVYAVAEKAADMIKADAK